MCLTPVIDKIQVRRTPSWLRWSTSWTQPSLKITSPTLSRRSFSDFLSCPESASQKVAIKLLQATSSPWSSQSSVPSWTQTSAQGLSRSCTHSCDTTNRYFRCCGQTSRFWWKCDSKTILTLIIRVKSKTLSSWPTFCSGIIDQSISVISLIRYSWHRGFAGITTTKYGMKLRSSLGGKMTLMETLMRSRMLHKRPWPK